MHTKRSPSRAGLGPPDAPQKRESPGHHPEAFVDHQASQKEHHQSAQRVGFQGHGRTGGGL